jgi:hypothetical protein
LRWQSQITAWEPPSRFVDEQRRGPYRLWVHEHAFVERDGGTRRFGSGALCRSRRWLLDALFVRRDLKRIFSFRQQGVELPQGCKRSAELVRDGRNEVRLQACDLQFTRIARETK